MKLRILGNSIILRLSQSEVKTCQEGRTVTGQLSLPQGNMFQYQLEPTANRIDLSLDDRTLKIALPQSEIKEWARSDSKVGIYHTLNLDSSATVDIVVEKDFRCLTARPSEDESDLYPNPNEAHGD